MVELDKLPIAEFQTLYSIWWKEKKEEEKLTDEEKGARQLGRMIEDNIT